MPCNSFRKYNICYAACNLILDGFPTDFGKARNGATVKQATNLTRSGEWNKLPNPVGSPEITRPVPP